MSTQITSSSQSHLAQQLAALSPAKRSLLELRLMRKHRRQSARNMTIPRQPNRESAPLSYNQQGLWVLNQLMPGTSLYHTPMAVRLTGSLDVAALKNALNMVVARHEALRTTFGIVDGSPTQVVAKSLVLDMHGEFPPDAIPAPEVSLSVLSELRPLGLEAVLELVAGGAQLLDTRESSKFEGAHLKGSVNVGLGGSYLAVARFLRA